MKSPLKTVLRFVLTLQVACCAAACGGAGNPLLKNAMQVDHLQFTSCPASPLKLGQEAELAAMAYDQEGNPLPDAGLNYRFENPEILKQNSEGKILAKYPGSTHIFATLGGIESAPCVVAVSTPSNARQVVQLTDNAIEDHWGMNNNWSILSGGKILWLSDDGVERKVLFHDLGDSVGQNAELRDTMDDVDFMAMGSSSTAGQVLISWREGLSQTMTSRDGAAAIDLGPQFQEENSISDGVLLFRKGLPYNDIMAFSEKLGLSPLAEKGSLSNPIANGGQALCLEDQGGGNYDLVFFDGGTSKVLTTAPLAPGRYDLREGRVVYIQDDDIFLFDATTGQTQNITQRPQDLPSFVKTDGHSIVFLRNPNGGTDQEVVLYDIVAQEFSVISTTGLPKDGNSLQIDFKQAIWLEGSDLYFHDGSSDPAGTSLIPQGNATLALGYHPYLSDGVVAWIGNDGNDTEVFVMK